MSPGERLYRGLLRLYPPAFRREYAADLVQAFRDRGKEPRHRGPGGRLRLGMLIAADLVRSVPLEWWRAARHGGRDGSHENGRGEEGAGMGSTAQDVGFAVRSWSRRPGYALAMVLTLAVGIGGATAMFGVLDRVVLRPLPYEDSGRLVQLGSRYEGMPDHLGSVSPGELHRWRRAVSTLDGVAGSRLQALTLHGDGDPEILEGAGVSGSFFDVLRVEAGRGRLFGDADDRPDAAPVAVLTHGTWQRRFGADPDAVGRTVVLDEVPFTIVGVLPPDYVPPEALYHGDVDVYFPLQHVADDVSPTVVENAFLQVVGRLAAGVGLDAARAELAAVEEELLREHAWPRGARTVDLEPLHARTVGGFDRTLLPFLGAVGLLLLVACANAANLSLVRATERGREMAVRTALGAGRARLVRQLLTESLLLAAAAAALGALVAWGAVGAFRRTSPDGIPRAAEVTVDPAVLAFALGLAVVTGLVFGLAPVLHVLRAEVSPALGRGGRSGASGGRGSHRLRSTLVVGELAMALVLVVGAGLLARSLAGLVATDLGFEPAAMAYMTVASEGAQWEGPEGRLRLYRAVHERLAGDPAILAAGGTSNLPLSGNESVRNLTVEGFEAGRDEGEDVSYNLVLPGFFEASGIPLVEGRGFRWTDDGTVAVPVVVNRAMARRFWSQGRALGGRLHFGGRESDSPWMEVVGVAGDVRQLAPGQPAVPQLYVPFPAFPARLQSLVVRTSGDAAAGAEALRQALRDVAPELPVLHMGTMEALLADAVVRPRFFALLLGAFAATSLLLAVVGVYGTTAYAVRQRTRELGVRMALGADRRRVQAMVLRRGLGLTAAGLALGLVLSVASTRLLEGLIYGVTPTDPLTLAGACGALAAPAALASWLPAAHATRIDPSRALRAD